MQLVVDDSWAPELVLKISGEIDAFTGTQLRERLTELIMEPPHRLVLDLESVGFLDSTGLGVLVGGLKRARENGGDLILVCTRRSILKVLQITGLDQVFQIFESAGLALAPQGDEVA